MQLFVITISIIAFTAVLIAVAHEPATEPQTTSLPEETGEAVLATEQADEVGAEVPDIAPEVAPATRLIQDIAPQRTEPVFFEQIGPEAEQPRFSPYVLDLRGIDEQ